jgi:hypothetical protein
MRINDLFNRKNGARRLPVACSPFPLGWGKFGLLGIVVWLGLGIANRDYQPAELQRQLFTHAISFYVIALDCTSQNDS